MSEDKTRINIKKKDFIMWLYHSIAPETRGHTTIDKLAYLIETELRNIGYSTGYEFNEDIFGPFDQGLDRDIEIMTVKQDVFNDPEIIKIGEPMHTHKVGLTPQGKYYFINIVRPRLRKILGDYYTELTKKIKQLSSLNSADVVKLARKKYQCL